jgi:hypothetical protein
VMGETLGIVMGETLCIVMGEPLGIPLWWVGEILYVMVNHLVLWWVGEILYVMVALRKYQQRALRRVEWIE